MNRRTRLRARRAALTALAAAAVVPAAVPALASAAGTVSKTATAMTVKAGAGDANALKVYVVGAAIIAEDKTSLALTAGAGCVQLTSYRAGCTAAGLTQLDVDAGDLNDTIDVDVPITNALLVGGAGNDSLRGVGAGQKVFGGSAGFDTVTYSGLTVPVYASLDATLNDGPFDGAPDFIGADVEGIVGGSANDLIVGGTTPNSSLSGGPGNDSVQAGSAGATLLGGTGNDIVTGGAGNDSLSGNEGSDTMDGKGGNDLIVSADGVTGEKVTCGSGTDTAFVDVWDAIQDPAACESVLW
ncbi:MAG: hypothetical protein JHD16_10215 [Solirubrobacteraceae bacterium]|nr:hypothetical protein [Solirubrobacteraceae bacterium]